MFDVDLPFQLHASYPDDDISDRLHHRWTVVVLLVFLAIVGREILVGYPLRCWCPAEFTDAHCNYTEAYCWIEDNYYIKPDDYIPNDPNERNDIEIKYYQWVPIILMLLALSYKMPNLLWTMMNTATGINVGKMVQICTEAQIGKERQRALETLSRTIDRWLRTSKRQTSGVVYLVVEKISSCFCFCIGTRTGTFLAGLYLDMKLLYIGVSVGLLFLLNRLLSMEYLLYGAEVLADLLSNTNLPESPKFPRVILCDFQIRQLQNLQRYTVQCVLSINLFYEKMFAILWFWFFLLIFFSTYTYIKWMINIIIPGNRIKYVAKFVALISRHDRKTISPDHDELMNRKAQVRFARDYLGMDGVFVLRMLELNTNEMVVYDLMKCLMKKWKKEI